MLEDKTPEATITTLLSDIDDAEQHYGSDDDYDYALLRLKVLRAKKEFAKVRESIDALDRQGAFQKDSDLAYFAGRFLRRQFGDDARAISVFEDSLRFDEFDDEVFMALVTALTETKALDKAEEQIEKWQHRTAEENILGLRMALFEEKGRFDDALKQVARLSTKLGYANVQEVYLLLRKGDPSAAEKAARAWLKTVNYSSEAEAWIVNLELAMKKQGKKVDATRLEGVIKYTELHRTKAAAFALLGRKQEMLTEIKEVMKSDKTFRFDAEHWPVFDDYKKDIDFAKAIAL
jgi:hypothetical protein